MQATARRCSQRLARSKRDLSVHCRKQSRAPEAGRAHRSASGSGLAPQIDKRLLVFGAVAGVMEPGTAELQRLDLRRPRRSASEPPAVHFTRRTRHRSTSGGLCRSSRDSVCALAPRLPCRGAEHIRRPTCGRVPRRQPLSVPAPPPLPGRPVAPPCSAVNTAGIQPVPSTSRSASLAMSALSLAQSD